MEPEYISHGTIQASRLAKQWRHGPCSITYIMVIYDRFAGIWNFEQIHELCPSRTSVSCAIYEGLLSHRLEGFWNAPPSSPADLLIRFRRLADALPLRRHLKVIQIGGTRSTYFPTSIMWLLYIQAWFIVTQSEKRFYNGVDENRIYMAELP